MKHNVYYNVNDDNSGFHVWRVIEFPYINQESDGEMWIMSAANTALIAEYACLYSVASVMAYLNDRHDKDIMLQATVVFN